MEVTVEDVGMFSNATIGGAQFDLQTVYEYPNHEVFGHWVALTDDSRGGSVQGFLRLSMSVLKEGDTPKIHGPTDLDDQMEPDIGVVMGMPNIETEGFLLVVRARRSRPTLCPHTSAREFQLSALSVAPCVASCVCCLQVRVNKVELAPYGIKTPDIQIRMRFGATEVKSRVARAGYKGLINDELRMPVFTPSLTDRIAIEVIDAKSGGGFGGEPTVICSTALSRKDVMSDLLETQWINMYGVRPMPRQSLIGQIGKVEDESAEDTAYRGRVMVYAACEKPKLDEKLQVVWGTSRGCLGALPLARDAYLTSSTPRRHFTPVRALPAQVIRLPLIFSKSEVEAMAPRTMDL